MSNQQYVTITHYKEREFYFLNHAIQTNDGFITKDIEQFHESEKEQFIERIRALQVKYPIHQVISISLTANQVVKDKENSIQASARIFKDNYVMQEKIDIGNIPVTLYFSPFSILYEEYKHKLNEKLTLMIGLFNRKLYIMFATQDKIHQSWTLGTRGLTEKQIADRVYKSMKAYYKISFKFADNIEMLVSDESPKLLKVLRTELSMNILPTQKTIHSLLHHMGADQRKFSSSYMKSSLTPIKENIAAHNNDYHPTEDKNNLDDIKLNDTSSTSKSMTEVTGISTPSLISFIPLSFVLLAGAYFHLENTKLKQNLTLVETQSYAQTQHELLAMTSKNLFNAMGKSADLQSASISDKSIELKGVVWGIEPLRNSLTDLYSDGEFIIKPLENFMTEFSFKSKI